MNKKLKVVIIAIIILILVALNIYVFIKNYSESKPILVEDEDFGDIKNETEEVVLSNTINTQSEDKNLLLEHYQYISEADRIQSYIGNFLLNIRMKKYVEAYAQLNDKFKSNYFSSLDAFKEYAINTYPSNLATKYGIIERQGEIFVIKVTVFDMLDKEFQKFDQRMVVREEKAGEFKISFQVETTPVVEEEKNEEE